MGASSIRYGAITCALEPGETVLEGLERHGASIPSSCRVGACQSCLLQARAGTPPALAQRGLRETWRQRGYFLACVCRPSEDLELAPVGAAEERAATVAELTRLSPNVTRVRLALAPEEREAWTHEPGQFLTLLRADGLARSYSIASLAREELLELHVRHMLGGRMSTWLHEQARVGDAVRVRGPLGECFYTASAPETTDAPLLLAGTGTGLAPLWGILREALRRGHRGPITLVHGARTPAGLYLQRELTALADGAERSRLRYVPCALELPEDARLSSEPLVEPVVGAITEIARRELDTLSDAKTSARAYICGDPGSVKSLKRALFLGGVSLRNIFSDAFVTASAPAGADAQVSA